MNAPERGFDIAILGGGVAGLWAACSIARAGFSCLLIEHHTLGRGQTIASQGIIHGGIKYALTGEASRASRMIADMPDLWRACLNAGGPVDLSSVRVLAPHQYLWTTPGIGSRLAGVAASRAIRTSVRSLARDERPSAFAGAPAGVNIYQVDERVLDPFSLVAALRSAALAAGVVIEQTDPLARLPAAAPRAILLTAGAGNAALAAALASAPASVQQIRPLHMVMLRERTPRAGALPTIFGHCLGMSDKPRVTITTQPDRSGRTVWYVGGQIAERGVHDSREHLIDHTRRELRECVPWVNLDDTEWATLRVDRAEGVIAGREGERPDEPVIADLGVSTHAALARSATPPRVLAAWPTKLALAPRLASMLLERLAARGITPHDGAPHASPSTTAAPPPAPLPWDEPEALWT